jgi:RNA-directed DNA polymerase
MTPRQHFDKQFTESALRTIFEERIANTATTGKDGISSAAFGHILDSEITQILTKVRSRKYRFTAYRQKLVLKGAGKAPREISIATVRDRIVLRAVSSILIECFSDKRQAAPHHFIHEISELIKPLGDDYSFIQIDVRDFYPSIVHTNLMTRLRSRIRTPELLDLIQGAIRTPTGSPNASQITQLGVPQGLSISNILSAIYMIRFDELMHSRYSYFRYVDDIIIICKATKAEKTFSFVARELLKIGLVCHEPTAGSKSKIVLLSTGVDYLGYHLRPNVVSVRKSSYRRMIENIMAVITSAKSTTNNKKLLRRLNIKVTGCVFENRRLGWMFFFSMTLDLRQLRRLDSFVARAWSKAGMEKFGRPKTFIKSYHEIRYRLQQSKYIPRFDEYTKAQKAELISDMEGKSLEEVIGWTEERINRTFAKHVRKEVSELEKDLTPFS